jgi:phenylacetate-coenzyme A ligase PaaK-like adenylate-forming protein
VIALELRQRILKNTYFEKRALEVFQYQSSHVSVYKEYIRLLHIDPKRVTTLDQIPFLPIQLFKSHTIISQQQNPEIIFTSSGTTGVVSSQHYIADISLYEESFRDAFELFYGDIKEWCILALLPSYLERESSSLVYMINDLMRLSNQPESGFYLYNLEELSDQLQLLEQQKRKTLLIGVTYALVDLAEQFPQKLSNTTILETGGMKGRRKEMVREELHMLLCDAFHISAVHSEYGMTELLSQAYSKGDGLFRCPPWMRIQIREMNDPFAKAGVEKTGGINIIDLANLYSCSFIATSDLGKLHKDGSFEVLGRFDNSDIRGCNLMVD